MKNRASFSDTQNSSMMSVWPPVMSSARRHSKPNSLHHGLNRARIERDQLLVERYEDKAEILSVWNITLAENRIYPN